MFDLKRLLIIVDVRDWAWDIASKELAETLVDVETTILDIADALRLIKTRQFRPKDFDVVLMYPWANRRVVSKLATDNTVICVAGGEQLYMKKAFIDICGRFKVFGACNGKIKEAVESWLPNKKVVVLSHGVDTEKFKPNPIPHEGFIVGWAGNIVRPLKRFRLAERIVREADVYIKVAGQIGSNQYHRHDDMPGFYNFCDMLLVTSEAEAHPMVVYEALSCGIPVASTRVGDVSETLRDGLNGFLLNVDNGTIDLRTGELRSHNREDYITHILPTEYDPDAICELWDKFIDKCTRKFRY